jgi:hypothetical protein
MSREGEPFELLHDLVRDQCINESDQMVVDSVIEEAPWEITQPIQRWDDDASVQAFIRGTDTAVQQIESTRMSPLCG